MRGTRRPISTARLCAELWAQIKDADWSLVSETAFVSNWPLRLWNADTHYQFIGASGGYGQGYGAPAAVGAALANRRHGRLSVNIQNDGDLMYAPGVLWTAAHHHIPLLSVMHNNRAYHQETMHVRAHGEPASARDRALECRHRRSPSRPSTTRRSRRAWASTPKDRSRIRTISAPPSGARWPS